MLKNDLVLCSTKEERYKAVVKFMINQGISFKPASPDHIKNCYRIMENGSSAFVYNDYIKLNCCLSDKQELASETDIQFEILYKNKKD